MTHIPANVSTISAEAGTSITAPRNSPAVQPTALTATDSHSSGFMRPTNISAIITGNVSIDIRSITPTSLIVNTIQTAVKNVMTVVTRVTGNPVTRAKSRSNAQAVTTGKRTA